jgi:DNA-directed RNA polymerase subunit alpha
VIGVIPIDAAFSPVRKANFYVDETRVGSMTNFERLTLEVWTDGSITPKEAIGEAAHILTEHIQMFADFDETYVEEEEEIDEEAERRKAYLSKPVAELELSVRSSNCLEAANIATIRDLVTKTESDMLKYRNFGRKSLNEIKDILADMGLSFGMVLDDES